MHEANIVNVDGRTDPSAVFIPITMKVRDACNALGVRRTTLFRLMSQGRLQRINIGRCTLVTTESMRNLVANSVDLPGER
jgi:hypothetical protein